MWKIFNIQRIQTLPIYYRIRRRFEDSEVLNSILLCAMDSFLCCCAPCKPRYKRLVDAIYPRSLTDGLINSNMQKLTFYAISQPEKLGRIAEYIVLRMSRDLSRQRYNQVKISVEAMDQLLQSCHDLSSLGQFIENFLRMLQKLLETNNNQLEKLASDSFVNFANIEENTPAYHREYDFFISKFAAMCHSNNNENAKAIRYAGLRGLRGVLWKSACDPLQACIWEDNNMEKIVPSILFNLQEDENENETVEKSAFTFIDQPYVDGIADSPKMLADQFLRELMAKAPFGLISALKPVFCHFDLHNKWDPPPKFAVQTFRAIMYSVKDPSFVVQALVHHLETKSSSSTASVRIGIATVLSNIVSIAGSGIGPSLLGIFNSLLKHLRHSVEYQQSRDCPSIKDEKIYQETLINALGDYANALPDYQKVEIMMFTVGNIPKLGCDGRSLKPEDEFLQYILVKTLLKISTKYKTAYLATMFTDSFLDTLLQLTLASDPCVRSDTQRILHSLFDRHDNLSVLCHLPYVADVSDLQLTVEKSSRSDQMFMQKHISVIVKTLFRSIWMIPEGEMQDEHFDANLCTMALLCVEVGYDEVLIELFRLCFALQTVALDSGSVFSSTKRIGLHNLVAKYLNLSCQLMAIPSLCQHVEQVIQLRSQLGVPELCLIREKQVSLLETMEDPEEYAVTSLEENAALLFDKNDVMEMLKASGKDTQRLAVPFVTKLFISSSFIMSDDSFDIIPKDSDAADMNNIQNDGEDAVSFDFSIDWSINTHDSGRNSRRFTIIPSGREKRNDFLKKPVTVDTLRQLINTPLDCVEEERHEQERAREILEMFHNEPFDKLVEKDYRRRDEVDVCRTVKRLLQRVDESNKIGECGRGNKPKNIFELKMPSFVY